MTTRSLTRWEPWTDLLSLQDQVNRLFESTFGGTPKPALLATEFMPPVDVIRDQTAVTVRADLPGMKKEDLDITVVNNHLFVRGTKRHETETAETNVHKRERLFGTFERVVDLPATVELDKITAKFEDGVLSIACPIREEARPRQITVAVN